MEAAGASTSRARWEVENEVQARSREALGGLAASRPPPGRSPCDCHIFAQEVEDVDELLRWNPADVQTQLQRKPWSRDPRYFRKVKISALALLKMAMHARSGGNLEVMGMVQVCAVAVLGAMRALKAVRPAPSRAMKPCPAPPRSRQRASLDCSLPLSHLRARWPGTRSW